LMLDSIFDEYIDGILLYDLLKNNIEPDDFEGMSTADKVETLKKAGLDPHELEDFDIYEEI
nr:hypothetical protein [Lachnospiraceae bacterium]